MSDLKFNDGELIISSRRYIRLLNIWIILRRPLDTRRKSVPDGRMNDGASQITYSG